MKSIFEMNVEEVCGVDSWTQKFEELPESRGLTLPSSIQPPTLELKDLPTNLKYAYLGLNQTYPVVISSTLEKEQELELIEVLKVQKGALGWTIADLHGIDPTICTHHIFLEEDVKPSRQPQRRLNPNIRDVVRKEIIKLLDAGIIYPISDSK